MGAPTRDGHDGQRYARSKQLALVRLGRRAGRESALDAADTCV